MSIILVYYLHQLGDSRERLSYLLGLKEQKCHYYIFPLSLLSLPAFFTEFTARKCGRNAMRFAVEGHQRL